MLGNGGYYMNSLNSRFWGSWIFFYREFDIEGGRRRELWFAFIYLFIKYIVFSFF